MKHSYLLLYLLSWLPATAQQESLEVLLSNTQVFPGDTLHISAGYAKDNMPVPLASLYLIVISDQGKTFKMRWPVIAGRVNASVVIDDSLPDGQYQFVFAAWPHFFTLKGHVIKPAGNKEITATLFTHSAEAFDTTLAVDKEGRFVFNNLLFENEARIFFSDTKKRNRELDLEIETALDSNFRPLSPLVKQVTIGKGSAFPTAFTSIPDSAWQLLNSLLPNVLVFAVGEMNAEKLNKKYVHGLFDALNARDFVPDTDPFSQSSRDVIQYISNRVPGLQLVTSMSGDPLFFWRREPMQIYIDEMKSPGSLLYGIPLHQVALIKIYPPPFFGNMFGSGGGIAVYLKDRQGEDPGGKHNFTIQGYTPLISLLAPGTAPF